MLKQEMIFSLMKKMSEEGDITTGSGVVEILPGVLVFCTQQVQIMLRLLMMCIFPMDR
jgi:transcription termination factor Rho